MDERFAEDELLLRAVYPESIRPRFWRNGRLSSAALKDRNGLSVSRTGDRTLKDSVVAMTKMFRGFVVSITTISCWQNNAGLKYYPSVDNIYHSEIHGSDTEKMLSEEQALMIARSAKVEYRP